MTGIAYLVSDHDAPSHTFVRREIAALREKGVDIIPFSVRPAGKGGDGAESLLGRSPFTYLAALAWGLFRRPRAFVASWLLACQHRGPGGRALIWAQFHFVEAILLGRRLHDLRVRHLHNHFANSGATVGMLAARFAGIPWSLTLHGISGGSSARRENRARGLRRLCKLFHAGTGDARRRPRALGEDAHRAMRG